MIMSFHMKVVVDLVVQYLIQHQLVCTILLLINRCILVQLKLDSNSITHQTQIFYYSST